MVKNPQKYLSMLKKKGFHKIIVHYEAFSTNKKLLETLFQIRDTMKMKAFIAINPETPIIKVFPLLAYVDGVLLMGVHPGKEHQDLIPEVFAKISVLRERDSKMPIQIDGGVNIKSINNLKKSGATIFNSGSFVAESKNPKKTLQLLQTA
jgi:ribulose-phosphate 3-epimerase